MGIRSRIRYFLRNTPKQLERSRQRGKAASSHLQRTMDLLQGYDLVQADMYRQVSGSRKGMIASFEEEQTFSRLNSYPGYILDNKAVFAQLMDANGVRAPKLLAVFRNGELRWEKNGMDNAAEYLERDGGVIIKPTFGTQGSGVEIARSITEIEAFSGVDSIVTELISQQTYSSDIFAGSLNTIRVLSVCDPTGEHILAGAVHRFGTSRSAPVDNLHAGGLVAEIDRESGVMTSALDRRADNSVGWVECHPETGAMIQSAQVADWDMVKDLVRDLGDVFSYFPIIGWDIAIAPDGPVVIEGNAYPGLALFQMFGPFSRDPYFEKLMSQYFSGLKAN